MSRAHRGSPPPLLAGAEATTLPVADPDRRFYAFVLDRVVGWGVVALVAAVAYPLFDDGDAWAGVGVAIGAWLLVGLASALVLGLRGTSVGRAALGLRTVDHGTGAPIGIGPALLRTLVLGAGTLPTMGLGTATLAWTALVDPDRRGWHDHRVRSVVVDVRPPPQPEREVEAQPHQIVNLTAARLAPAAAPATAPATGPATAPVTAPASGRHVSEPGALGSPLRSPVGDTPDPAGWRISFDTGESFAVHGLTLLGRRPEPREGEVVSQVVQLVSPDMSLSKTHAQLHVAPEGVLVVTDRGSTNGSVLIRGGVSRELSAGRPATLLPGDLVRFGDRQMTVARDTGSGAGAD